MSSLEYEKSTDTTNYGKEVNFSEYLLPKTFTNLTEAPNSNLKEFKSADIPKISIQENTENDDRDIADLVINDKGILEDSWLKKNKIPAIVTEIIDDRVVVLDCLLDKENKEYEERVFEYFFFQKIKQFAVGKLIQIIIYQMPGEIKYKFLDGEGTISRNDFLFEVEQDLQHKIENSDIFKSK